jgi:hypothetical protein
MRGENCYIYLTVKYAEMLMAVTMRNVRVSTWHPWQAPQSASDFSGVPRGYGKGRRWGGTCARGRRHNGEGKRNVINILDRRFMKGM